MNHFLMTLLRSQQLSMQLASTVGLQVRRAIGVCSQAACRMLFLTINRCLGVGDRQPEAKAAASARDAPTGHSWSLGKGEKVGRSEIEP